MTGPGRGPAALRLPEVLESTRRVDTIVLDKTGTVTTGRMALAEVVPAAGVDHDEARRLVAALESASEHPVARAIAAAGGERLPTPESFRNREGLGVEGVVEGAVVAGRPALLAEWGIELGDELAGALARAERDGKTAIAAAWDGEARALFVVADQIKPTSAEAIRRLRELGLRPVLLTGDNTEAARVIAAEAGVEEVIAEVLRAEKARGCERFASAHVACRRRHGGIGPANVGAMAGRPSEVDRDGCPLAQLGGGDRLSHLVPADGHVDATPVAADELARLLRHELQHLLERVGRREREGDVGQEVGKLAKHGRVSSFEQGGLSRFVETTAHHLEGASATPA